MGEIGVTREQKVVEAAKRVIGKRGMLMRLLVNKPTPWLKPHYNGYVAPEYQNYYDVPAEEMDALAAALEVPELADALLMDCGLPGDSG